MQPYIFTITGISIIAVFVFFFWVLPSQVRKKGRVHIHDAILTTEGLEAHAREMACEHVVIKGGKSDSWPLPRMVENYNYILSVYKTLNEFVQKNRIIPPAAEWLLDNFYIVEEQVKSIRRDFTYQDYAKLPTIRCGDSEGVSRVYALSLELVAHTNGQIDENTLLQYLKAYQSNSVLSDREIWAMSSMLRIALIENIRYITERIKSTVSQWIQADELLLTVNQDETGIEKTIQILESKFNELDEIEPSFFEHLVFDLKRSGRSFTKLIENVERHLEKHGLSIEAIAQKEHNSQATGSVTIGNCIIALKHISSLDWTDIFNAASRVENMLNEDPDGTYPLMDTSSKSYYRKKIEDLSFETGISEAHIAKIAVELARSAYQKNTASSSPNKTSDPLGSSHIGYYLFGHGIDELKNRLYPGTIAQEGTKTRDKKAAKFLYTGSIIFFTLLFSGLFSVYTLFMASDSKLPMFIFAAAAGAAVLIPVSEVVVFLANQVVCKAAKPYTFPRLEFRDGIPKELATMIVIPALLPDAKRVGELLENLETHYLSNKENHFYFALAGDFKDAPSEKMPGDNEIIEAALKGIELLNQKYSRDNEVIFYFFHRVRKHNENQNKWMGWERKRGALIEFNDLLLGSKKTSYTFKSSDVLPQAKIKYVITLDADTLLPIDGAKKMLGTIAHPLSKPVFDKEKGLVTKGYGLIQPRVIFDIQSANKTLFSRIFTGQEGLDPYACAISDVYQDLFHEGIFTGKGIYDLEVFQKVLKNAVPDNAILSHDLLEGSFIRTGLATDIELVDSYPSGYNSYIQRLHRWVRGDWQLLPWLKNKIFDKHGNKIDNPLSYISKWKIFDNLRRSLYAPAFMLLVILGFSFLPGSSLFWLCTAVFTLFFPFLFSAVRHILFKPDRSRVKSYIPVISGLRASLLQIILQFIFIPHQAYMMCHAIIITLIRVFITKKNMLEWVTAADVEKGQKNSFKSYWAKMKISFLSGLVILILSFVFKPDWLYLGITLLLIWTLSPYIAYRISRVQKESEVSLTEDELQDLRKIARKTYRYFEEFANHKNNYLAPDNFQADPPNGIAYRTSPTNIGLGLMASLCARDFGFAGIMEMTDMISNTTATMEKMEKWNGHLYNWYNTRTLIPLKPRYISTVDSGNLVCYLITLVQGLNEYLEKPLLDTVYIHGISDTLSFIPENISERERCIQILDTIKSSGLSKPLLWKESLDQLLNVLTQIQPENGKHKKSPWISKTVHMISMLNNELDYFMPWLSMVKELDLLTGAEYSDKSTDNLAKLSHEFWAVPGKSLKQLPDACQSLVRLASEAKKTHAQGSKVKNAELANLLDKLSDLLDLSIKNTNRFIDRYEELIARITTISDSTDFKPLYVEKKQLFSIGYNIEENRLTNSFYDLLASEARQTSYIAIARGEVPYKHWFKLGRALTVVDQYKGLVSWTGTMFEYLMPFILMKSYKNTILDETYSFVVRSQKKYGKQRNIPWGVSESGFYSLDLSLDYQYKAIGVPWLGLKRGLVEDAVVTPYATFLALPIIPREAMDNIKALRAEGMDGPYGFYEAVDYTPERMPFGMKRAIVKSFMAHHQGMSLLSLNNFVHSDILQNRFHADPVVKAAQLLLQEKVPANVVYTKEAKEKVMPFKETVYKEKGPVRKFSMPDPVIPKVHILSNGNYSIMITDKGTGYSRNKMAAVTRWREDSTFDIYGMFFYMKNMDTGDIWSAAYGPYNILPQNYEVTFTSDKAVFKRSDKGLDTEMEITVTTEDNAEIRRLSIKNTTNETQTIEITSYFEVVLASLGADIAHPAFSNLFIKTEWLPQSSAILANRRPRSDSDKSLWLVNTAFIEGNAVGGFEYETDRTQFIGRGRSVSNPAALDLNIPFTNSSGAVLDPIMSLRVKVKIAPGEKARITYLAGVGESRESVVKLADKYKEAEAANTAFKLALTRSQVETRYLNAKTQELELYQDMASHILFLSPLRKLYQAVLAKNRKGQPSLWPYGISGDLPIILVILKKMDHADILFDVLKAHEYWRIKDLKVDIVILNEEENSYHHPLGAFLSDVVTSGNTREMMNRPGGIYIVNRNNIPEEDVNLLHAVARLVIKGDAGSLEKQLQIAARQEHTHSSSAKRKKQVGSPTHGTEQPVKGKDAAKNLEYFNGLGGFSKDGKEYVIILEKGQITPMPWINVVSNPRFGFLVTESGSGYTWNQNSRENKLTPWSNDPVSDIPGEVIYLHDSDLKETWSVTPLPIREDTPYIVSHGFGYSRFEHSCRGIDQSLTQFVPVQAPVKISILKLKNTAKNTRNLNMCYYIKPVLGVSDQVTAMHIQTKAGDTGAVLIENPYNDEFSGKTAFVDISIPERSMTGDRKEFFGSGNVYNPEGVEHKKLSGALGAGYDPCAVMQTNIHLAAGEEKEIVLLFGQADGPKEVAPIIHKYNTVKAAKAALEEAKGFWADKLFTLQIQTPESSMNILINGWLLYQVTACRLWARSAFYQSGGAYGFRDQLQDSIALAHIWPEVTRNQILLHASHQFIEGDVQHWWHEPQSKGTRTKFSDDLLWLPYATAEYIRMTEDYSILNEDLLFLEDELLTEHEDEKYSTPRVSSQSASLYEHCIRAIEKSLKFGEHGIPLMGAGDWNDGMNTVGNKGKGESVWLGWFLSVVLRKFEPLCRHIGDMGKAENYAKTSQAITDAIEENAWDGNWYRRAYFDNGVPLGSVQNSECKIDSLSQSWAVISGAARPDRAKEAMASLDNYLVRRDEGLIKLLTPPFDESDLEPGYIKGYVPGVRENGAQYTHAAAWTVIAFALFGDGNRASELFNLINPINHTRTQIEYWKYKVEPYVMAADVYAVPPHTGRGGWTWYTGSASWMYRAGLEYILGIQKHGNSLKLEPCIPDKWKEYSIQYKFQDTSYEIKVKNPKGVHKGIKGIIVDGDKTDGNTILLVNDRKNHKVEVEMG